MKKIIFPLFLFILILGVTSCHFNSKEKSHAKVLTHNAIKLQDEYIGNGGFLLVCKDGLVGLEESSSLPVFYYMKNSTDVHVLSRFLNRGQGPNEVLYPINIQYINEDTIGMYDIMNMSYYNIPILKENDSIIHIKKTVSFDTRYYRAVRTSYNQYIALSAEDGLFSLLDADGKRIDKFFDYPYKDRDERNIDNAIRALAYQGTIVTNPHATKCVYAPFNGDIIHFYAVENNDIRFIHKTENTFSNYNIEDGMARTKGSTIRGYVSITATDNFVYALYCGKTIRELMKNNDDMMEGEILRVFDWNGNIKKEIDLDIPCKHISISHDDKTLWAIALNPETSLVWFNMNDETERNKNEDVISSLSNEDIEENEDRDSTKSSSEVVRVNLGNIYKLKAESFFSTYNEILEIKSIEKTNDEVSMDEIKHINNHTILYYLITKKNLGEFSDTITVNFTNNKTYIVNICGNVIDNDKNTLFLPQIKTIDP
jgi:hypothetical protein